MAISASIKTLLKGEQVAGSKMSRQLTDELMAEGLLSVVARGSRKSYRAQDTEALRRYLIDKDESYRVLEIDVSDSRASMARDTGNSKLAAVRSCPGFPINSYEPIACRLNGSPWMVDPQRQFPVCCGLEDIRNSRGCHCGGNRKYGKLPKDSPTASPFLFRAGPPSSSVRFPLSTIHRPPFLVVLHTKPLHTFRRFRSGRHKHFPHGIPCPLRRA